MLDLEKVNAVAFAAAGPGYAHGTIKRLDRGDHCYAVISVRDDDAARPLDIRFRRSTWLVRPDYSVEPVNDPAERIEVLDALGLTGGSYP